MRVLLDEQALREGVQRIASVISEAYRGQSVTLLGVMCGSVVFLADLIRQLDGPLRVGVIQARSYRGASTTSGELWMNMDALPEIAGRHVLIVDDIFDTGRTLAGLIDALRSLAPASVRSAVLLRKLGRSEVSLGPDFTAFEIPDEFVVGYGLDYQDAFRNLPYVAVLEAEEIGTVLP